MILVIGGTGIVGAHLLLTLTAKKKQLVATYRDRAKIEKTLQVFRHNGAEQRFDNIIWKEADIINLPAMQGAFNEITHVYHCAGMVSFAPRDWKKLNKINTEGTANVVNLALKYKIQKLAYVSSISTLGVEPDGTPITEKSIWNPEIAPLPYAISKYNAELEVWRGIQEGLSAVIINPGVILCAHFWNQSSGVFFTRVKRGTGFFPIGKIGCIAVEDVADALINLMESPIENKRYILVAENLYYRELMQSIAKRIHAKPPYIPLTKRLLYIISKFDLLASSFGIKQRLLTRPLVQSLCNQHELDGSKITRDLSFKYRNINKTLDKIARAFLDRSL